MTKPTLVNSTNFQATEKAADGAGDTRGHQELH
jgi:hypothetical protein